MTPSKKSHERVVAWVSSHNLTYYLISGLTRGFRAVCVCARTLFTQQIRHTWQTTNFIVHWSKPCKQSTPDKLNSYLYLFKQWCAKSLVILPWGQRHLFRHHSPSFCCCDGNTGYFSIRCSIRKITPSRRLHSCKKDEVKMGEYLREEEKKRKVLIINTGGTIGSKYTDQGIVVLLPPNR